MSHEPYRADEEDGETRTQPNHSEDENGSQPSCTTRNLNNNPENKSFTVTLKGLPQIPTQEIIDEMAEHGIVINSCSQINDDSKYIGTNLSTEKQFYNATDARPLGIHHQAALENPGVSNALRTISLMSVRKARICQPSAVIAPVIIRFQTIIYGLKQITQTFLLQKILTLKLKLPQIVYRGLTIPEVIALLPREGSSPSVEAVFWLLLTGDVPTQQQTASLIADWTSRRKKCTEWWSGQRGETIASVLRSMPETITPLHKLSVALTIFGISKQAREAKRHGAMPYTYWEYTYEDGMEFLATLPAIIGLIAKGRTLRNVSGDGDWVQFLLNCLNNTNESCNGQRSSIADFLRLYITLNADDDGGAPIAHITQILGSTDLHINEVLASVVLAHVDEPKSGTMLEWKELQAKIKNTLGRTWTEQALKACVLNLWSRDKLIGHKEADFCDPRYTALLNYAKQHLPNNTEIKLSQDITRLIRSTMRRPKRKDIYPEQNALAPVIFQYYGLEDMRFNQTILYMARALGTIASIIWTRVVNAPVEHPISSCTHSYMETIRDDGIRKRKRRTRK
ncbi:PREDICTED: probable citrate synthase 2, mitochondrial [Wasmannia auropunctata]|uniref:probable citrate synthase 2, mitochondrial n=1 Tax=Wasmannia auropunctata TaxID=64793 RepID=UPI0005EEFAA2|nr:PREDICTED: probable citrate synthase 2, mitochondrial [Wasmannia auropunctata]